MKKEDKNKGQCVHYDSYDGCFSACGKLWWLTYDNSSDNKNKVTCGACKRTKIFQLGA